MKAPATNRATNEVTLIVGAQRIELRVLSGTVSDHGVKREEWINVPVLDEKGEQKTAFAVVDGKKKKVPLTEDHKVGRGVIDKVTEKLLTYEEQQRVAKKIATEDGQLVWLSDSEIEDLFAIQPDTLVVKAFQPLALYALGEYVPEKPYFVQVGRDKKSKPLKRDAMLLAALLATMAEDGLLAVCELTTRGLPKPALLFPDGGLWQVWHTDALREGPEQAEVSLDADGLEAVRLTMINDLRSDEVLDLSDKRTELVKAFAEEKAAAGDFAPAADAYEKRPKKDQADETDILALLGMSVEKVKAAKKAS